MDTRIAKKFLCIDDDRTLLLIVKQILNKAYGPQNLEVYQASTGEDGLQVMQEEKPDIILVDIHMPGIDGFEVCRRIRQFKLNSAVILMSAYDAKQDNAIKATEAGADAYLSKPLKKGELLFVVNFVLRAARLTDSVYEKNRQLEESLGQMKQIYQKLAVLNEELRVDKRRLGGNLKEMTELNQQLEEKNDQISSIMGELAGRFDSTENLLSSIIELHQIQHRGHAERVSEASVYIAEEMKLADYQVVNIKSAALLHELGIVALPTQERRDEAIDEGKSRPSTNHALVGEMLLKGFPGFEMVAEIIRHLHENVDGTGSPDRLYGDRIPIGSRIVSAVSYFDHSRISHPKLSQPELLEKMEKLTGKLFDENVFLRLTEYIESKNTSTKGETMDCSVFALSEGMELASNIYSESGIHLLRKGTVLDKDILDKVIKFHNMDPIAGTVKIKLPY